VRKPHRLPIYLAADAPAVFPDPRRSDPQGLIAVGGDLSPPRLLAAYAAGIFPWYEDGYLPMWWCPDPRALLTQGSLHVSHSLQRRLRRGEFTLSWNRDFAAVMTACGEARPEGSWIFAEMLAAYTQLHRLGHAHSLEVWRGDELVGGIYGVQVGGLFAAESMFHRATDASKVALVALVRSLFAAGTTLFDVQFVTAHLQSMGAFTVPRVDYLQRLHAAGRVTVDLADLRLAL
jgi:leucyl/phenylalanyl-tRNA--protein transferase